MVWPDGYLLGVGTAVAFAGRWPTAPVERLLQPWWRVSLWVAFPLLWLLATLVPDIDLIEPEATYGLALNLTTPPLLCVAAASVRWREIAAVTAGT